MIEIEKCCVLWNIRNNFSDYSNEYLGEQGYVIILCPVDLLKFWVSFNTNFSFGVR
jgi:hypothetical protein